MQASKHTKVSIIQKETRTAALFIHMMAQHMSIQFTDIRCLNYLMDNNSATAGEIASATGLTTGAVTAMLDRLEKYNLVYRQADESDRRKIIIKLKNNNFKKTNTVQNFFTDDVEKLLSTFSKKELEVIVKWNLQMTKLFQNQIKKLQDLK